MANAITPFIRALVGAIQLPFLEAAPLPALCLLDAVAQEANKGQTVQVPFTSRITGQNAVPAGAVTLPSDITTDGEDLTLNNWKTYPFYISSQDEATIAQTGQLPGFLAAQIQEAARAAINDIHGSLADLHAQIGQCVGAGGTTPFASNSDLLVDADALLFASSVPLTGRAAVLNASAMSNMKKLSEFKNAYAYGGADLIRKGILPTVQGFGIAPAVTVRSQTRSSASGFLVNHGGGYAAGTKTLAIDTGSNAFGAGDLIKFAGHARTYAVVSATSTQVVLSEGLVSAVADDEAISFATGYNAGVNACNLLVHPSWAGLGIRVPAGGTDLAVESYPISVPVPGGTNGQTPDVSLPFRVNVYKGYKAKMYEIEALWGVTALRRQAAVRLLG